LLTIGQSIDRTKLGAFRDALYANKDTYATKYHPKWSQFKTENSAPFLQK